MTEIGAGGCEVVEAEKENVGEVMTADGNVIASPRIAGGAGVAL